MKNIKQPAQTDSKQMSVGRFKRTPLFARVNGVFSARTKDASERETFHSFLTSHQSAGKKKSARFQTPGQMRL